jgi:UDP-N-acetylglucosamine transferase subunit ALG13
VVVAVGTDHHPFQRLLDWVQRWPVGEIDWVVQHGSTPLPSGVEGAPVFGYAELEQHFRDARAVVCHGGPGLIMDLRRLGHRPIVVPRRPDLGEHVDGHQVQFVEWLSSRAPIRVATDEETFRREVRAAVLSGPDAVQEATSTGASARLARLVDDLVRGAPPNGS